MCQCFQAFSARMMFSGVSAYFHYQNRLRKLHFVPTVYKCHPLRDRAENGGWRGASLLV